MREDSFVGWMWDPHHHDCIIDKNMIFAVGEKEIVLAGRRTSFGQEGMGEKPSVY